MSLPDGFVLDDPPKGAGGLPDGFVLDDEREAVEKYPYGVPEADRTAPPKLGLNYGREFQSPEAVDTSASDRLMSGDRGIAEPAQVPAAIPPQSRSVMDGRPEPAPVSRGVSPDSVVRLRRSANQEAVARVMQGGTEAQRSQLRSRPDDIGAMAREEEARLGIYNRAPEAVGRFDPRREARSREFRAQGANPEVAQNMGQVEALAGLPTLPAAVAQEDTDTAAGEVMAARKSGVIPRAAIILEITGAQLAGGADRMLGDLTGDPTRVARAERGLSEAERRLALLGPNPSGSPLVQGIESALVSVGMNAPAMMSGAMIGGPAGAGVALGMMVLQSAVSEYGAGRSKGLSADEAALRAGIMGAAEGLGEKFGMTAAMRALRGTFSTSMTRRELLQALGDAFVREVPGEQLTTAIQFWADTHPEIGLRPDMSKEEAVSTYLSAVGDTLLATLAQSGMQSGAAVGTNAALRGLSRPRERESAPPGAIDLNPPAQETPPEQSKPKIERPIELVPGTESAQPVAEVVEQGIPQPVSPMPEPTPEPAPEPAPQSGIALAPGTPVQFTLASGEVVTGVLEESSTTAEGWEANIRADDGQPYLITEQDGVAITPVLQAAEDARESAIPSQPAQDAFTRQFDTMRREAELREGPDPVAGAAATREPAVDSAPEVAPAVPPVESGPAMVIPSGDGEYVVRAGDTNLATFRLSKKGRPTGVKYFFEARETRLLADEAIAAFKPEAPKAEPKAPAAPMPARETITPANDKPLGENDAGEKLYEREDGSRYRMRKDTGRPDFGGDLALVEAKPVPAAEAPPAIEPPSAPQPTAPEMGPRTAPQVTVGPRALTDITVNIRAVDTASGKRLSIPERADVALAEIDAQLKKARELLECLEF